LTDLYPNSMGWVLAVLAVGAVISIVAAYGYNMVARVANIAAPWMVLVFLAFGFVALRNFMDATGTEVRSAGDLWRLADEVIWRGGEPLPGQIKFTFWHVTFFAWFCNMAMHIGMADLSLFRYARRWTYGFASAFGMFLGHFVAWISSGILCAAADVTVAPGPIAYMGAGVAGAVCVVVAGWTTANPTLYRAGLALQAVTPNWKRWKVTLAAGLVTTAAACFPALVMRLLEFVALYGLILMPMGAVILADFWIFPRLGLQQNYAAAHRRLVNWPAALSWCLTLLIAFLLPLDLYFKGLPGWFAALFLYTGASAVEQRILVPRRHRHA
jgi:cytosine permease